MTKLQDYKVIVTVTEWSFGWSVTVLGITQQCLFDCHGDRTIIVTRCHWEFLSPWLSLSLSLSLCPHLPVVPALPARPDCPWDPVLLPGQGSRVLLAIPCLPSLPSSLPNRSVPGFRPFLALLADHPCLALLVCPVVRSRPAGATRH